MITGTMQQSDDSVATNATTSTHSPCECHDGVIRLNWAVTSAELASPFCSPTVCLWTVYATGAGTTINVLVVNSIGEQQMDTTRLQVYQGVSTVQSALVYE